MGNIAMYLKYSMIYSIFRLFQIRCNVKKYILKFKVNAIGCMFFKSQ